MPLRITVNTDIDSDFASLPCGPHPTDPDPSRLWAPGLQPFLAKCLPPHHARLLADYVHAQLSSGEHRGEVLLGMDTTGTVIVATSRAEVVVSTHHVKFDYEQRRRANRTMLGDGLETKPVQAAMTDNERQKRLRQRRARLGLLRREMYVHPDDWPELRRHQARLLRRRLGRSKSL